MKTTRLSAVRPARRGPVAKLSLAVLVALAVPGAHAIELKLDDGWKGSLDTTISLGTSWRVQAPEGKLFSGADGARIGVAGGTGGTNTDSGNLNWDKGDRFSTLLRATFDLSLSKGDMGLFTRVRAWYDHALETGDVRAGHHGTNWALNAPLSDSGYDRLQKFSNVALLDAYVYNTFDAGGKPLQVRLGNQVINWGESLFIQGINQINPIDLNALRKPGAEVRDAFLPVTALSANLGLGEGRSLEAFYQFRWQPSNIDSCGAYFGVVETQLTTGANKACSRVLTTLTSVPTGFPGAGTPLSNFSATAAGLYVPMTNGRDGSDSGQFGVAFRFPAKSLDAEFGLYAMQYSARTPFVSGRTGSNLALVQGGAARSGPQVVASSGLVPGRGFWEYPDDVRLYGISASKNIAGWSVGAEISRTPNQPVQINANDLILGLLRGSGPMGVTGQTATAAGGLSGGVEVPGFDRISKNQFQVNALKIFPRLMGSAQGVVVGEVAFQRADLPDSFTGRRYGRAFIFGQAQHASLGGSATPCAALGNPQVDGCKNDGFATDNSWGYRLRLGLEYPNFLNSGATLFPTASFAHDVKGYSIDNQFIEDRKTLGLSARLNINKVHNVELSMIRYADSAKYDPFRDRDFVSLNFSTSF